MVAKPTSRKASARGELAAGWSALIAAVLAVTAWAACCVLPIALSFAGLSLAGLGFIAGQRAWLTAVAAVILAGGWWMAWRRRRTCAIDVDCAPPSRLLIGLLTVGSVLVVAALAWKPLIEPWALKVIQGAQV